MLRLDEEAAPALVFDPLADLFFSVVAIVVLAVIIILPTIRLQASAPPDTKAVPAVEIGGRTASAIRATATGLLFGPDGTTKVALNAIDDDPALSASLRRARQADAPLLILIEPDGDEAAFQLEPVLVREGVASVTQVRLDPSCNHLRTHVAGTSCPIAAHVDQTP